MFKRCMTVPLLLLSLLSGGAGVLAQSPQEKVDLAAIGKIKDEGLQHSQVMDTLSYLTDVYGPRLTGSPNIKAAQQWALQRLASYGLQNGRLEAWGPFGRGWSLEAFSAAMVAPNFSPLIAFPKAWSPSTNGVLRGEVVYL